MGGGPFDTSKLLQMRFQSTERATLSRLDIRRLGAPLLSGLWGGLTPSMLRLTPNYRRVIPLWGPFLIHSHPFSPKKSAKRQKIRTFKNVFRALNIPPQMALFHSGKKGHIDTHYSKISQNIASPKWSRPHLRRLSDRTGGRIMAHEIFLLGSHTAG